MNLAKNPKTGNVQERHCRKKIRIWKWRSWIFPKCSRWGLMIDFDLYSFMPTMYGDVMEVEHWHICRFFTLNLSRLILNSQCKEGAKYINVRLRTRIIFYVPVSARQSWYLLAETDKVTCQNLFHVFFYFHSKLTENPNHILRFV